MTQTISRDELAAGLEDGTITLVDALAASYFAQQHLPGAINLVSEDVTVRALELLPDKAAAIVTYCANPSCANSAQVAVGLERLGYTHVRTYPGGIEDWTTAGLPVVSGATV